MSIPPKFRSWEHWKQYWFEGKDVAIFEKKFANSILTFVPGLSPDWVIPQYPFKSPTGTGRDWHMDFAIILDKFDTKIAIELEGFDKSGNGGFRTKDDHNHTNARIQALTLEGWKVLFVTNSQFTTDPEHYRRQIVTLMTKAEEEYKASKKVINTAIESSTYQIADNLSEKLAARVSEQVSEQVSQHLTQKVSEELSRKVSEQALLANKIAEPTPMQKAFSPEPSEYKQTVHNIENKRSKTFPIILSLLILVGISLGVVAYLQVSSFNNSNDSIGSQQYEQDQQDSLTSDPSQSEVLEDAEVQVEARCSDYKFQEEARSDALLNGYNFLDGDGDGIYCEELDQATNIALVDDNGYPRYYEDINCEHFASQNEAQNWYEHFYAIFEEDIANLDGFSNKDGIACGSFQY